MAYSSIWLQNFRSYADYSAEFGDGVTIVVGPNGSGKTNLLEAVYVSSTGKSFRARDRDLLRHGADWMRLEALHDDHKRITKYRNDETEKLKKIFDLDGVSKQRLTHKTRLPIVLFEPDDLRLLTDSPSRRRDYMDNLLTLLLPVFSRHRAMYERVLLQRNNLLKQLHGGHGKLRDQLFVWDLRLAELGALIVSARGQLIDQLNDRLTPLYGQIAGHPHKVITYYQSTVSTDDYQTKLLERLHKNLDEDLARGFTAHGPHRDDLRLFLDGNDSSATASRGETRSLVLALKMIELELLSDQDSHSPILLLDDVFSELDAARRRTLAELASSYQTIITTTDADAIVKHFLSGYTVLATER